MSKILIVFWCWITFVSANKTLINKCCDVGEVLIKDTCQKLQVKLLNSSSIYTVSGALSQVVLNELPLKFTECHDGFRVITSKFKAFENGTLKTDHESVNDFCLNEDSSGYLVARYCSVEPCTNCVKKCCPNNMIYVDEACQLSKGRSNYLSSVIGNVTNVVGPIQPVCKNGLYALGSSEYHIKSNGTLVDLDGYATEHYCIVETSQDVMALLCFNDVILDDDFAIISVFPYLLFVSSIFLIVTFVVYLALPRLRNVYGLAIMCYTASLTMLYVGLGITQLQSNKFDEGKSTFQCSLKACVIHFAFLSSFTWLNVMSLDIWLTLKSVKPRNSRHGRRAFGKRFVYFSTYAWGLPLLIVSVGQILQKQYGFDSHVITPSFGKNTCWFPLDELGPSGLYLYGPIGVLILVNLVFFVLTIRIFYETDVDNVFASSQARSKQRFRVMVSLFFLMGISWAAEVISFAVRASAYVWLAFDIINILTGVFVFVIFVLKANVWKLLKKKFPQLARLDPCCPKFMTTQEAYGNVRSSQCALQQKLSAASSTASHRSISLQTRSDRASKHHSLNPMVTDKQRHSSTQSNQSKV